MSSFMEKLRAKKEAAAKGATQPAANTNAAESQVVASEDIEHDAEEAAAAIVGAINPPGEAGDVVDVQEEPLELTSQEAKIASMEMAAGVSGVAEVEAIKKRRGRPAGSKNKVAQTTLEHQLEASLTGPKQGALEEKFDEPTKAEAEYKEQAAGDGLKPITLLLVDCFIARAHGLLDEAVYASDLIAQAHQHIKTTYAVLDYRAGGHPELEYGKGAGLLAACIEGLIQDLPAGCVVVVDTRTPEGQIALQPLVAASISVVRGAA